MIPTITFEKENTAVQTDISSYGGDAPFDMTGDANLFNSLAPPVFPISPSKLEGIVKPLSYRRNHQVRTHRIPRLYTESNLPLVKTIQELVTKFPIHRESIIREAASAIVPELHDKSYRSLFSIPIQPPYAVVPVTLTPNSTKVPEEFDGIFSLNSTLTLTNSSRFIQCKIESWEALSQGKELKINTESANYGKILLKAAVPAIRDDRIPEPFLKALNLRDDSDLTSVITLTNTSFVDVALSIPSLQPDEANDLLAILHSKGILYPYIRSKVCEFQLSNVEAPRQWPELLGRFLFLLDPSWTRNNVPLLKNLDVMAIFRHIQRDMNGACHYLLQVAFSALEEINGSDKKLFLWSLILMSLFPNASFDSPEQSKALKTVLVKLYKGLQKKDKSSKAFQESDEVINYIEVISQFKLLEVKLNEEEFVRSIFTRHRDEALIVLNQIPYRKEEASPLFFPIVLAIEAALVKAQNSEELSQAESVTESQSYSEARSEASSASSSVRRVIEKGDESSVSEVYSEMSKEKDEQMSEDANEEESNVEEGDEEEGYDEEEEM